LFQVYYLKNQNELITNQNERMKQQAFLQEADRRSNAINLLDQIIKEVTTSGGMSGTKSLLESDNINLDAIIDPINNNTLITSVNFNYAELKNASLTGLNIKNINLDYSNLENSNFKKSIFRGHKGFRKGLNEYTSFKNADLQNTIFSFCDLELCDFSNSDLNNSSLKILILVIAI